MLKQEKITTEHYCIIPVHIIIQNKLHFLWVLKEIGIQYGVSLVCLNQEMMAGSEHVKTALIHAIRSWKEGRQIARSLEMEVLLYAAGTRQTNQIEQFGPVEGENNCYLCIIPGKIEVLPTLLPYVEEVSDENWNLLSQGKKEKLISFFSITPEELGVVGKDKLTDLICERSALLTVHH